MKVTKPKTPSSYRLSAEAVALLRQLHKEMGVSRASVLEMAIRGMYRNFKKRG